jgi:hypothetical protein
MQFSTPELGLPTEWPRAAPETARPCVWGVPKVAPTAFLGRSRAWLVVLDLRPAQHSPAPCKDHFIAKPRRKTLGIVSVGLAEFGAPFANIVRLFRQGRHGNLLNSSLQKRKPPRMPGTCCEAAINCGPNPSLLDYQVKQVAAYLLSLRN